MSPTPEWMNKTLAWPINEPIALGILGSMLLTSGLPSIFGLRAPLEFVPVFLFQLFYKSIWFLAVALPLWLPGHFPGYATPPDVLCASYVIGNLIAIPFR